MQKPAELPPEATFDDYLAMELPPDDVEIKPIDLSLAQMQTSSEHLHQSHVMLASCSALLVQKPAELPPEATFDDYLAMELPPDDVEINPIDLSLAQMQSSGKDKGEPGAEVSLLESCRLCVCGQIVQSSATQEAKFISPCPNRSRAAARTRTAPSWRMLVHCLWVCSAVYAVQHSTFLAWEVTNSAAAPYLPLCAHCLLPHSMPCQRMYINRLGSSGSPRSSAGGVGWPTSSPRDCGSCFSVLTWNLASQYGRRAAHPTVCLCRRMARPRSSGSPRSSAGGVGWLTTSP